MPLIIDAATSTNRFVVATYRNVSITFIIGSDFFFNIQSKSRFQILSFYYVSRLFGNLDSQDCSVVSCDTRFLGYLLIKDFRENTPGDNTHVFNVFYLRAYERWVYSKIVTRSTVSRSFEKKN